MQLAELGGSPAPSGLARRVATSPHRWPILLVALAVVVGNCLYLLGIFDPNPLNLYSGLGYVTHPGLFAGSPSADPNTGITAQALGHLAAVDWLHGHVPWWNPYEGLGSPLAGEMQSGAFFPPTLLLYFSNGQVYFHLLLELITGVATYALLTTLQLRRPVAVTGAIAFALCGTFSWFSHAPVNPIAFLPVVLLGIEMTATASRGHPGYGWVVIAVGLAFSLYAGFPETAYIDALLAAVWAVCRLIGLPADQRLRYVRGLGAGVAVGLLLAAPILIAFVDYIGVSDVGGHSGTFGSLSNASPAISQVFLPYVYGSIPNFSGGTTVLASIWNGGGYLTAPVFALALVGLWAKPNRALRIGLALWMVVALGRSYGVAPFQQLTNLLPAMKDVAFYRYADASWTMAGVVLAAMGIEDIVQRRVPSRWVAASGVLGLGVVGLSALEASTVSKDLAQVAHRDIWNLSSIAWAGLLIVVIFAVALSRRRRVPAVAVISTALVVNALGMFIIPQLSAPRSVRLYTAPVAFLDSHLGTSRFYSLGPLPPNYGSYYGLASLASNDIPQPTLYDKFVTNDLGIAGIVADPSATAPLVSFMGHLRRYESAGVKYLVTPGGPALPTTGMTSRLRLVLSAPSGNIYALPQPKLLLTVSAGCAISHATIDSAVVTCRSPGTLVRHETYMPGWAASVGTTPTGVAQEGAFQRVDLPKGRSVVAFRFLPPHELEALVGLAAGLVVVLAAMLRRRRTGAAPLAASPS